MYFARLQLLRFDAPHALATLLGRTTLIFSKWTSMIEYGPAATGTAGRNSPRILPSFTRPCSSVRNSQLSPMLVAGHVRCIESLADFLVSHGSPNLLVTAIRGDNLLPDLESIVPTDSLPRGRRILAHMLRSAAGPSRQHSLTVPSSLSPGLTTSRRPYWQRQSVAALQVGRTTINLPSSQPRRSSRVSLWKSMPTAP